MSSGASARGASHGWPEFGKAAFGKTRMRRTAVSSASAKLSSDAGGFFIHQVSHVGAADQRAAEHHFEANRESVAAVGVKLSRRNVGGHRQVPPRRLQVLADGGDVDVYAAKIAQKLLHFAGLLAQANHQPG